MHMSPLILKKRIHFLNLVMASEVDDLFYHKFDGILVLK